MNAVLQMVLRNLKTELEHIDKDNKAKDLYIHKLERELAERRENDHPKS